MYLKFIGKDGSMGLKHGEYYDVKIVSRNEYIYVKWGFMKGCPYRSPQTLAANWTRI